MALTQPRPLISTIQNVKGLHTLVCNLFVGYMEECGIYVTTVFSDHVRCWFRYIDILLIWDGSKPVFLAFVNYLNVIFPGIVFNPEISTHNITYLDVIIKNVDRSLSTFLYYLDVMIKNVDKNDQKFSQNQQTGIPCTTIGACILSTF